MDINAALTAEFHLRPQQMENTVKLIDDGNTIPFIARYRKEMTGAMDDQLLRQLYAIGNNMNQIAARANSTGFFLADEYARNADELRQALLEIQAAFTLPERE